MKIRMEGLEQPDSSEDQRIGGYTAPFALAANREDFEPVKNILNGIVKSSKKLLLEERWSDVTPDVVSIHVSQWLMYADYMRHDRKLRLLPIDDRIIGETERAVLVEPLVWKPNMRSEADGGVWLPKSQTRLFAKVNSGKMMAIREWLYDQKPAAGIEHLGERLTREHGDCIV